MLFNSCCLKGSWLGPGLFVPGLNVLALFTVRFFFFFLCGLHTCLSVKIMKLVRIRSTGKITSGCRPEGLW